MGETQKGRVTLYGPAREEIFMESLAFGCGMMTGGIITLAGMALHVMATRAEKQRMSVKDGVSRH
ncbi:MAG TPA: hypothetical protein VEI46_10785 [Thermodesulfovibrionales bacterium]|nr:hypothetical protein [Thermodesulfovibrionales bacterium]